MIKFRFIAACICLFIQQIYGQGCLPGGITFNYQVQVDSFSSYYPGCNWIEGSVSISGSEITHLDGLAVLDSIGGDLSISLNPNLPSLSGLGQLSAVRGSVTFSGNPGLADLAALYHLNRIGGALTIANNDQLVDLNGLQGLKTLPAGLNILMNDALISLAGLDELTSIQYRLGIKDNASLQNFSGLGKLVSVGDDVSIEMNQSLQNFCGLGHLESIGGSLKILGNHALVDLKGLENLHSVGKDIDIGSDSEGNAMLSSLDGMQGLTTLPGYLRIQSNDRLLSLEGLDNLISIRGDLTISYNDSLLSLSGLGSLESIEGSFAIHSNQRLASLEALSSLADLGPSLFIQLNPSLVTLAGLDQIEASTLGYLNISLNNALSACDVAGICDYLAIPLSSADILANASGCNSREEVESACASSIDEKSKRPVLFVFPNPSSGKFILVMDLHEQSPVTICIYNPLGQVVSLLLNESLQEGVIRVEWDSYAVPDGLYYCHVSTGDTGASCKLRVLR